ncbi:MAG: 2-dehydro-3-deoxyphosphogluconate aldolase [Thermoanaerobaculia bacterium]|jgi:2-dehydro-3-deoxyphosphogluconate aldolase/(4S)-4-hydroxy-2-oxoglutarate aldolase
MNEPKDIRRLVATSLAAAPVVGVVRTSSRDEALRQAGLFMANGIELIEVTFTVPDAPDLVRELIAGRSTTGPPWIGMGTVTDLSRAEAAVEAGAEFLVSPNVSSVVTAVARRAGLYLVLGALTCTEIVEARDLGADIVKVYPLPPVGGPAYLATIRGPLDDIPMLAAGGFSVDEIPDYRVAGASAFGIGAPLLGDDEEGTRQRIAHALRLAKGQES